MTLQYTVAGAAPSRIEEEGSPSVDWKDDVRRALGQSVIL